MLSRTANSLYWIGRYVERAEFTAKLIEATIRLDALSARPAGQGAWDSALLVAAADQDFALT
ncbi:MAG: alpha-E domain-containing protein, partial [Alphaproteobacteria bacterium]